MYAVVVLALVGVVVAEEKYTTKYDNINIDYIINNDRLFTSYFNCLMDKGSCTPDGAELKKRLTDALESECAKCSEKQKESGEKIFKHLIENKADLYSELQTKYDPEGKYSEKYKNWLKQIASK